MLRGFDDEDDGIAIDPLAWRYLMKRVLEGHRADLYGKPSIGRLYLGVFGFKLSKPRINSCKTELLLHCGIIPMISLAAVTTIQKMGLERKSVMVLRRLVSLDLRQIGELGTSAGWPSLMLILW